MIIFVLHETQKPFLFFSYCSFSYMQVNHILLIIKCFHKFFTNLIQSWTTGTHKILSSNHVYLDFQQREVTPEVLHNLPFLGLAGSGQWGRRHDIRGRNRARVGDVPTLTQLGRGAGCPDFYTAGVIIVIQRTHSGAKIHKCIFDIWDIKIEYWATYTGISRSTCTYFVTGVSTGSVFMPSLFHFDSTSVVSPLADSCSTVISNPPKPVRENELKQNVFISEVQNKKICAVFAWQILWK